MSLLPGGEIMSHCPYSDESLEQFDSVANPMGDACDDCDDYDCELTV